MEKVLIDRNEMKVVKINNNKFNISFNIKNEKINLIKLINIDFIKIIYEINKDLIEKFIIEKKSDTEARIFILCKDLFTDLGLPQFYYSFNIKQDFTDFNNIKFIFSTILNAENAENENIDKNMLDVKIDKCIMQCSIINEHYIQFNIEVLVTPSEMFSSIIEKMISMMIYNVFNRVKQFIGNM
jgi:hypothetical protein